MVFGWTAWTWLLLLPCCSKEADLGRRGVWDYFFCLSTRKSYLSSLLCLCIRPHNLQAHASAMKHLQTMLWDWKVVRSHCIVLLPMVPLQFSLGSLAAGHPGKTPVMLHSAGSFLSVCSLLYTIALRPRPRLATSSLLQPRRTSTLPGLCCWNKAACDPSPSFPMSLPATLIHLYRSRLRSTVLPRDWFGPGLCFIPEKNVSFHFFFTFITGTSSELSLSGSFS